MPRCTPCIIPYNGKVRQESFWVSGSMAACIVLFTKSSREGHDFAAIIFYSILVPNKRTYLFFLPLLFSNTHRQKALTLPRSGSSVVLRQAVRFCVHQPPLSKGGGTGAARDGRIPTTGKLSWKRNPSVIACGDASPLSQGGQETGNGFPRCCAVVGGSAALRMRRTPCGCCASRNDNSIILPPRGKAAGRVSASL